MAQNRYSQSIRLNIPSPLMAWKLPSLCLNTHLLPATNLANSCEKNIKQAPESTDTQEWREVGGGAGGGGNESVTAHQLLPFALWISCQWLFNLRPDLSILNNTAISARPSPQLLQEINCIWFSQETQEIPLVTKPRLVYRQKDPALSSPHTFLLIPV
jgi:hypothetical protein